MAFEKIHLVHAFTSYTKEYDSLISVAIDASSPIAIGFRVIKLVAISEGEIGAILDGSILVVTGNLRLS